MGEAFAAPTRLMPTTLLLQGASFLVPGTRSWEEGAAGLHAQGSPVPLAPGRGGRLGIARAPPAGQLLLPDPWPRILGPAASTVLGRGAALKLTQIEELKCPGLRVLV